MKPDKVPKELLRHPVEDYLGVDPYAGDESELECQQTDIVRTRQKQFCTMGKTDHPAGTVMWREKALVDGQFQSNYLCLPHVAICIDFGDGGEHDPYSFDCAAAAAHVPDKDDEEEEEIRMTTPRAVDQYAYRVIWSDESKEYIGLCDEFPSLSWMAKTRGEALGGIEQVVAQALADMAKSGETPPPPHMDEAAPRGAKMTAIVLATELRVMAGRIEIGDSLEGSLRYTFGEEPGTFEVEAAYRTGNREGQGSMRLIGGGVSVELAETASLDGVSGAQIKELSAGADSFKPPYPAGDGERS